jgi:flagellar basal-body rod protein FlgC
MPMNSIATSLTGLHASSTRVANSANNTANISSSSKNVNGETIREAYTPVDTFQTSLRPQGGTKAITRERDPATVPVYDPHNQLANDEGIIEYPNVDLDEELVEQQIATYDYKANLNALKTADEMMESMLDISS